MDSRIPAFQPYRLQPPYVAEEGDATRRAKSSSPGQVSHCPCYGLIVRLRLLATLPRGNAVTFDYTPEHRRGEDFHLSDSNLLSIALEPTPLSAGRLIDGGIGPTWPGAEGTTMLAVFPRWCW